MILLLNPKQIRHFGIMVPDNPTDKTRTFGITGDDYQIPFTMQGRTVYSDSYVPMAWEHESYLVVIELMVDTPRNPGEVNKSSATASAKLTIEEVTFSNVCALDTRIPRRGDESCGEPCNRGSDLGFGTCVVYQTYGVCCERDYREPRK